VGEVDLQQNWMSQEGGQLLHHPDEPDGVGSSSLVFVSCTILFTIRASRMGFAVICVEQRGR
jgi:hypothetical protein